MNAKATAIVNGVVGDHLDATNNELATTIEIYTIEGTKLSTNDRPLARACIFVHGLTDDESVWSSSNTCANYGELLRKQLGVVPLYVRYNSGLHVSTNGERMSELLESKLRRVSEIDFICHSMGGLVTRSACLHATKKNQTWVHRVRRIVFLGTPHHGSFWEKMGNVVSNGMAVMPFMRLASDVANLRSAGIKDLRYGYVQREDWEGVDPDAFLTNSKKLSTLLPWVDYYIVSGTVTKNPNHVISRAVGDALVRKDSAQGVSDDSSHTLTVPSRNIREFAGVSHLKLPNDPQVYEQLKQWIEAPCTVPSLCRSYRQSLVETTLYEQPDETTAGTRWAMAKGATTLLETAIDKGTTGVEELNDQITTLVYGTVAAVSPVPKVVRSVELIHSTISKGVFSSIRLINYGVAIAAKTTFIAMDSHAPSSVAIE